MSEDGLLLERRPERPELQVVAGESERHGHGIPTGCVDDVRDGGEAAAGQWRRLGMNEGLIKKATDQERAVGTIQLQIVCTVNKQSTEDVARFEIKAVVVDLIV